MLTNCENILSITFKLTDFLQLRVTWQFFNYLVKAEVQLSLIVHASIVREALLFVYISTGIWYVFLDFKDFFLTALLKLRCN